MIAKRGVGVRCGRLDRETVGRCDLTLILTFVASSSFAQAPRSPLTEPSQQDQADKALQTKSGQNGKEEPSSHAATAPTAPEAVFVNGALAVPGAPLETDTVPSKFSSKNADDDELITLAYTFKSMPSDQRQTIYEALKDEPTIESLPAEIGTELPISVQLREVPDRLVQMIPQTKAYQFAVSDHHVLLVTPVNRIVVAAFPAGEDNSTGVRERVR